MDLLSLLFLVVISVCVPMVGYLIPQDPAVARVFAAVSNRFRHRQTRRWVAQQRRGQP